MAKTMVVVGLLPALLLLACSPLSRAVPARTARNVPSNPGIRETDLEDLLNDVALDHQRDEDELKANEEDAAAYYKHIVKIIEDEDAEIQQASQRSSLASTTQGMRSPAQVTPAELGVFRASPLHGVLRLIQQRLNDQHSKQQQQLQQRRHAIRARLQHLLQQRRSAVPANQQQLRNAALELLLMICCGRRFT